MNRMVFGGRVGEIYNSPRKTRRIADTISPAAQVFGRYPEAVGSISSILPGTFSLL
jgi:hypothetical protein